MFSARNGWEALGAVRVCQPDLVILDVMMPLENGYKVSKIIKDDSDAGVISKNPPVILLTARDVRGDKEREEMLMKTSRAELMIYKPFDMYNLIESVNNLLLHCLSKR